MVQRAAALMGEPAQSYAEAGAALARKGVFSPEDLRLYRAVVGFRNVLVHGYTSVDILRISQILAGRECRKLANDWVQLSGLRIYGLDWREDPRSYPAAADADVVLVHSPDAFQAARQGVYLAGHTHGLTSVNTAKPTCLIRRMRYMFN